MKTNPLEAKPYLKSVTFLRDSVENSAVYPFNLPLVQGLERIDFHPDVTFFVGENGTGKSTLVEAIALALGFGAEGGTRNVRFETAHTTSPLYQHLKLVRSYKAARDLYFLRAESFYNVASYMDEVDYLGGYGGISLHARSHGEAFLSVLTQKLQGQGLYLFDEPEAALSPTRQMAALTAIHQLVKADSQFIIATHSPILLSYPRAKILRLEGDRLVETRYEETEHFRVMKDFMNHYETMLEVLLSDGEEDF